MTIAHQRWSFALTLILSVVLSSAAAPAAVDMSTGIRYVIPAGTLDDCSAKAKTALDAYLQNAVESTTGSGEWVASGPIGVVGPTTTAATVRCYPVDKGYVATFTCVVQTPDSPYTAAALCVDIAHNFSGKAVTPLPTPAPIPTGCTTANLVGTWVSDDDPTVKFTFSIDGSLLDSDGVTGSWSLYGDSASFTYNGQHAMKLSSDGKHLRGGGYSLTRKC